VPGDAPHLKPARKFVRKEPLFEKSGAKTFRLRASGVGRETPQTQINKSFLLLFYKKAELLPNLAD
jgi:hypothetical protein